MGFFKKLFFWVLVFVLVYSFYGSFQFYLLSLLKLNPIVWAAYLAVSKEVSSKTLLGLFYSSLFGALFFISIPVEIIFIYYLSLHFNVWQLVAVVAIGNLLGMVFNYFFGFVFGQGFLRLVLRSKFHEWQSHVEKWGSLLLFLGNVFPSPVEILALFLGSYRYSFFKFLVLTLIAKIIKYFLLYSLFVYFYADLVSYWHSFSLFFTGLYNNYLCGFIAFFQ